MPCFTSPKRVPSLTVLTGQSSLHSSLCSEQIQGLVACAMAWTWHATPAQDELVSHAPPLHLSLLQGWTSNQCIASTWEAAILLAQALKAKLGSIAGNTTGSEPWIVCSSLCVFGVLLSVCAYSPAAGVRTCHDVGATHDDLKCLMLQQAYSQQLLLFPETCLGCPHAAQTDKNCRHFLAMFELMPCER